MPPRRPAKGVLEAARNFAREEIALAHRYANGDENSPHTCASKSSPPPPPNAPSVARPEPDRPTPSTVQNCAAIQRTSALRPKPSPQNCSKGMSAPNPASI